MGDMGSALFLMDRIAETLGKLSIKIGYIDKVTGKTSATVQ
jgi:hypothetical protein